MLKLKILRPVLCILGLMFMASCASTYTAISPENNNYTSTVTTDSVRVDYRYETLPKKYARKAELNAVRLVSIRVTNNSGKDLIFGQGLNLTYQNGNPVSLIDNNTAYRYLSQTSEAYLLYLLLTPLKLINGTNEMPIGYIVGPGTALLNFFTADGANKQFKNELITYSMIGKTIPNGGVLDGIVAIRSRDYSALQLSVK